VLAYADGNIDKSAFHGGKTAEGTSVADVVGTQFIGTSAHVRAVIERGFFSNNIAITSLSAATQAFAPGPPSDQKTVAAAFGFVFANGQFITGGQEKSAFIPAAACPAPSRQGHLLLEWINSSVLCRIPRRGFWFCWVS